jgi:hypothetical protein
MLLKGLTRVGAILHEGQVVHLEVPHVPASYRRHIRRVLQLYCICKSSCCPYLSLTYLPKRSNARMQGWPPWPGQGGEGQRGSLAPLHLTATSSRLRPRRTR